MAFGQRSQATSGSSPPGHRSMAHHIAPPGSTAGRGAPGAGPLGAPRPRPGAEAVSPSVPAEPGITCGSRAGPSGRWLPFVVDGSRVMTRLWVQKILRGLFE